MPCAYYLLPQMFQKNNINVPKNNNVAKKQHAVQKRTIFEHTTYLNPNFQRYDTFLYKKMKKTEKNRKKTPKKRCKKTTAQKSDAFFVTYLNIS